MCHFDASQKRNSSLSTKKGGTMKDIWQSKHPVWPPLHQTFNKFMKGSFAKNGLKVENRQWLQAFVAKCRAKKDENQRKCRP